MGFGKTNHTAHSQCFVKEDGKYYCIQKFPCMKDDLEDYEKSLQDQKDAELAKDKDKIIADLDVKIAEVQAVKADIV